MEGLWSQKDLCVNIKKLKGILKFWLPPADLKICGESGIQLQILWWLEQQHCQSGEESEPALLLSGG